ncbi:MAG: hypothetical protein ACPLYF_03405 [Fervidobacterium sp.]
MDKEKKKEDEKKNKTKGRGALMLHMVVAFLILIILSLMVVESSMEVRLAYFFIYTILFAVYNVAHLNGIKLVFEKVSKKAEK